MSQQLSVPDCFVHLKSLRWAHGYDCWEAMVSNNEDRKTELQVSPPGTASPTLVISGDLPNLHNDPARIHQLLDLLNLPKGTEVKVVTTAASVIVR